MDRERIGSCAKDSYPKGKMTNSVLPSHEAGCKSTFFLVIISDESRMWALCMTVSMVLSVQKLLARVWGFCQLVNGPGGLQQTIRACSLSQCG